MNRPEFHKITALMGQIRDALSIASDKTVDAINKNTETTQASHQLSGRITVEIQIPTETAEKYYSDQNKNRKAQWATFWVTVATVLALVIYTCYTRNIWLESKKSADAAKSAADTARDTLRMTLRPRVTIPFINPLVQSVINGRLVTTLDHGKLKVGIEPVNTGPLAATNVRFFRYDYVGARESARKMSYEGKELVGEMKLIPPKTEGISTSMSLLGETTISADDLRDLKSGKLWATFSIMITYDDDFGITHHAEYCDQFTLKPYNDICPWAVRND